MSETKSIKSDLDNSKKKFDVGSWLIPIIAVLVALFVGGILIKLQGLDPIVAYRSLFKSAFGSLEGIGVTLAKATPLVLAGLAVAVGLRAGLFNIGAQGQLLSRAEINWLWINSIEPTSTPRVGCAATSTGSSWLSSRATTTFCLFPPESELAGLKAEGVRISNFSTSCSAFLATSPRFRTQPLAKGA